MEYLEGFNKNKIKAQKIVQNIVDPLKASWISSSRLSTHVHMYIFVLYFYNNGVNGPK